MRTEPTAPTPRDLETTLDFINTLEHSRDGDSDRLTSPEAAGTWLAAHELLDPHAAARLGARELDSVRGTRDALRELAVSIVAERPPSPVAVETVNGVLRARDTPRIVATPSGVALAFDHAGDPLLDALAHLAEPLVELVGAGDERLRICDSDTCRWVFFDRSRTARRRWCDMTTCGNRAKAARHRARRRRASSVDSAGSEGSAQPA